MSDDGDDEDATRISSADQVAYWTQISADDNGMLGGYPQVSRIDLQFSRNFMRKLRTAVPARANPSRDGGPERPAYAFRSCLEAGAGIGRVTLNLLASLCESVDVVEPIAKFTARLTAEESPMVKSGQLRRVYNMPLQDWSTGATPSFTNPRSAPKAQSPKTPASTGPNEKYDLIFNQWCLTYLSSADLVRFLTGLTPLLDEDGWIIVKENTTTRPNGDDIYWTEDSSVTRSDRSWRAEFEKAGLKIVRTQLQTGYPKGLGLLPVRMYALRPQN